jgi:hypothetical protein
MADAGFHFDGALMKSFRSQDFTVDRDRPIQAASL